MNVGLLIVNLFTLALVTGAMYFTPNISRPTVPLGVSVPSNRVQDPVVRAAIHRYRTWCLVGAGLALVGTVATYRYPFSALWVLVCAAVGMVAFARCRRPIQQAKAEQGWYDGLSVRVGATLTAEPPEVRVVWPLHLLSLGLALACLAAMVVAYRTLPDPLPVHYGADGQPNRWLTKSWSTVLHLPLTVVGSSLFMLALCWVMARHRDPHLPDGDPQAARAAERARGRTIQLAIGWVSVTTTLLVGALAVAQIGRATPTVLSWLVWGGVAATLAPSAWLVWHTVQVQRTALQHPGSGPESPDDDAHWKLGMFYANREDPRVFVPKRSGIGLDLNYASPGGVGFLVVMFLVFVVTMAMALTAR